MEVGPGLVSAGMLNSKYNYRASSVDPGDCNFISGKPQSSMPHFNYFDEMLPASDASNIAATRGLQSQTLNLAQQPQLLPHGFSTARSGRNYTPDTNIGNNCRKASGSEITQGPEKRRKSYSCTMCPRVDIFKCEHQKHMRSHTGEKPFACHLCPHRSAQTSNLNVHLKTVHKCYKALSSHGRTSGNSGAGSFSPPQHRTKEYD